MAENNIASLLKQFKKNGAAQVASIGVNIPDPERIPSGWFTFDLQTGGGIPEGRISIIQGAEASMKTTLALKLIANYQKKYADKLCVFLDVEVHFSESWAKQMGVDTNRLVYITPENAEHVVDMMEGLLHTDDVGLIVVDSIAAMVGQNELDSNADKAIVGGNAVLVGKMYRKITHGLAARGEGWKPTVVLINQIRFKIGVMYGDPETVPGGQALKFGSSMTIRLNGSDVLKKDEAMPSYKKISVIIKKWKVPILSRVSELVIALKPVAEDELQVGESYDWNTVLSYLKSLNLFLQLEGQKGWHLVNEDGTTTMFPVQDALKAAMLAEPAFGAKVRAWIIKNALKSGDVISAGADE